MSHDHYMEKVGTYVWLEIKEITSKGTWHRPCLIGTTVTLNILRPSFFPRFLTFSPFYSLSVPPSGLSNIIGVIVYISAALSDISPKKDEDKKWHYSYGWSFYFGGLSFIMAEVVGVLAVNIYIERNKELRCRSRTDLLRTTTSAMLRLPGYRFRRRSRSSSRSTDPTAHSRDPSPGPASKNFGPPLAAGPPPFSVATLPNPHTQHSGGGGGGVGDFSMYTLSREKPPMYGTVDRSSLYQLHNYFPTKEGAGAAASVMMGGTLPSLSKSNLAASLQSGTATLNTLSSSGGGQQPPSSTATMERDRGHGTLDRDRDRGHGTLDRDRDRGHGTLDRLDRKGDSSNSNTLNRRTTPV